MRGILFFLMFLGGIVDVTAQRNDVWLESPVDDATFATFLDFFSYDQNVPFDLIVKSETELDGVLKEEFSYTTTAGETVYGDFYKPSSGSDGPIPLMILLHGGGPSGKYSPHIRQVGEQLARAGIGVLGIDMPHFGERADGLFTSFGEQDKHDNLYNQKAAYLGWVTQTTKDLSRSIDLMIKERNIDPLRIGLYGFSRGGIVASIAGAVEKRFSLVMLILGGHMDAMEQEHFAAACPANYIGRIGPTPLFTANGHLDVDMIEESQVRPLFLHASEPVTHLWSNVGHTRLPEEDWAKVTKWLLEHL